MKKIALLLIISSFCFTQTEVNSPQAEPQLITEKKRENQTAQTKKSKISAVLKAVVLGALTGYAGLVSLLSLQLAFTKTLKNNKTKFDIDKRFTYDNRGVNALLWSGLFAYAGVRLFLKFTHNALLAINDSQESS